MFVQVETGLKIKLFQNKNALYRPNCCLDSDLFFGINLINGFVRFSYTEHRTSSFQGVTRSSYRLEYGIQ